LLNRREVFQPIQDPIIRELMYYVKDFYFLGDNTDNVLKTEIDKMKFYYRGPLNMKLKRDRKNLVLNEDPNRLGSVVLINGEEIPFETYKEKYWDLPNLFEKNRDTFNHIKRKSIFQREERCKNKCYKHLKQKL
jgi:hypothetical protein